MIPIAIRKKSAGVPAGTGGFAAVLCGLALLPLLLLFLAPASAWGGNMAVYAGSVRDPQGNPLAGVSITCREDQEALTDTAADGHFTLSLPVALSRFSLVISRDGYFPRYETYDAAVWGKGDQVIVLSPLPADGEGESLVTDGTAPPVNPVFIEADTFSYFQDTDTYQADGNVVINYEKGQLTAATVILNKTTDEAFARDKVVLKSKQDVLEGDRVKIHIPSQTGVIEGGKVFIAQTHFYIRGDRIEKRGEAVYYVENAQATTCDGENPDWRLTGKALDVTVDGYGTIRHGKIYAGKMPLFYSPFILFPAKTTRQTGLLFPRMGYSRDKLGWDVGIPFYWAISKDADATFYQRYMSQRGFQEGAELRYAVGSSTTGTIYGDFLNDSKEIAETNGNISRNWRANQRRWSFYWNQETRFDSSMYFRADVAKVSDSWYFKDFSSYNYFLDNYAADRVQPFKKVSFVGNESLTSLDSTVRMVKNWKLFNLTALAKNTDDYTVASNDGTLQKYPEVTLTGAKAPLFGSPVNYEFTSVYDYFYRDAGQRGQYLDINPTLSLPLNVGDYFQFTPFGGVQGTFWWRDDKVEDGLAKRGDREVYKVGANMVSEVQRIFHLGGKTLDKIRHGIRPEITYVYIPDPNQDSLPNYGTVVNGQNAVTYALTNSLIARLLEKGGTAKYFEFFRFKLAQTYDFKEANRENLPSGAERRPFSDVEMEIDFKPASYLSFMARNKYSVYDTNWTQANYDLGLSDLRGDTASVTYRYTRNSLEEVNLLLKAALTKGLDLTFNFKRDMLNDKNIEQTYGFNFRRQCWNIGFSYGDRDNDKVYEFRFGIYGM